MAPVLYMLHASPPVRAVLITAKAIGVDLNLKEISFFHNDHLKPEFSKVNPQHTIPTLIDDDGFGIWDSHAIMIYLVTKYAKDDSLYPNDLKKRAVINQRLFFDSGCVFYHMRNIAKDILQKGYKIINSEEKLQVIEAYGFLNKYLDGYKWVAGDFLSIADYSLISTVSSAHGIIPIDRQLYPNLIAWLHRCEELPEYQANVQGLKEATNMLKIRLQMK